MYFDGHVHSRVQVNKRHPPSHPRGYFTNAAFVQSFDAFQGRGLFEGSDALLDLRFYLSLRHDRVPVRVVSLENVERRGEMLCNEELTSTSIDHTIT